MPTKMYPCPNCGSNALCHDPNVYAAVLCSDCRMRGPVCPNMKAAKQEWNKLPRKIIFSRKLPDVPGFWLCRETSTGNITGSLISEEDIEIHKQYFGDKDPKEEFAGPVAIDIQRKGENYNKEKLEKELKDFKKKYGLE